MGANTGSHWRRSRREAPKGCSTSWEGVAGAGGAPAVGLDGGGDGWCWFGLGKSERTPRASPPDPNLNLRNPVLPVVPAYH